MFPNVSSFATLSIMLALTVYVSNTLFSAMNTDSAFAPSVNIFSSLMPLINLVAVAGIFFQFFSWAVIGNEISLSDQEKIEEDEEDSISVAELSEQTEINEPLTKKESVVDETIPINPNPIQDRHNILCENCKKESVYFGPLSDIEQKILQCPKCGSKRLKRF
jgi:DNA-directed RNA polymerase subunit RPC12/RpoP